MGFNYSYILFLFTGDFKMDTTIDYCNECGCDLTHMDDGDDTCCWCLERIKEEEGN